MKKKSQPLEPPPVPPREQGTLSEQAFEFLLKEYDSLRDLFTQTESSLQSLFNFYLTLVTTVVGAIVLILQVTAPDPASLARSQFILSGLLVFAALIGSAYLSALAGRYAHLVRYAQGIDEIRRHLISRLEVPTPPLYQAFLASAPKPNRPTQKQKSPTWLYWLLPTGTYQLFVAVINSLALSAGVLLFFIATQVAEAELIRSLLATLLIFFLVFQAYNFYSHLVMQLLIQRLNIQVDTQRDLPFITGKQ